MDLYGDNIYDPILTGAQLQAILSLVCNLLYKCTDRRGVCRYMYICFCVYIDIFKVKAPYLLYSKIFLSSFFICLFIHWFSWSL